MTKLALVAANEFGLDIKDIKLSSTDTEKVANTSASAASATTDLNGGAVLNAIYNIKLELDEFIKKTIKLKKLITKMEKLFVIIKFYNLKKL